VLTWLIGGYGALVFALIATAAAVALFVADKARREIAYKILKLVLGAASGASTVAVLLKLHDAGAL